MGNGPPRCRRRAAGFTMLEMIIVVAVFGVMITAVYRGLAASLDTYAYRTHKGDLQVAAVRAMREIIADLKSSGRVDLSPPAGRILPYLFTNGAATGYFAPYSHAAPSNKANPGSQAAGASAEIVYAIPRDVDGDGTPINITTGAIEWSNDEWSIALLQLADGSGNQLVRKKNNVVERVLARNVNRILFEDYNTDATLGINEIRVTIWMVYADGKSQDYAEAKLSATVVMRNMQE